MSVSAHIAAQRTDHAVPHAVSCRALGVAASTFYKWRGRPPTPAQRRRADLDVEVKACFDASDGTYGSPRVRAELRRSGREVSKKTVESSMARQGLQGRARRRRRGLTRPDKRAGPVPDLLRRDFTAGGVDEKWVGDFKQIDTAEGPVFIATVEDLFSRRMLGFAQSNRHPTAQLATDAINMAAAVRGGGVAGVIFHTDKGSQYTSDAFAAACAKLKITQSMGRVGCALDNAAAESFFSTLQHELISRRRWHTRDQARRDIAVWIDTCVQQKTAPLHQQHDQPNRLRTSQRSLNQPSTIWGEAQGQQWFETHGKQTTNLASINLTTLKSFPVPAPSLEDQQAVVAELQSIAGAEHRLQADLDRAQGRSRTLRRSILAKAFTGQLVPQDPTDESASVLLDCIAASRATKPNRRASARQMS